MCGIFGFYGNTPDPSLLSLMATESGRRGPHSHGACWLDGDKLHSIRNDGSFSDNVKPFLSKIQKAKSIRWVVGHSRMTTAGLVHDHANIQPLESGDAILAHNGNVYNFRKLMTKNVYRPQTTNDSEAIFALRGTKGCKDWLHEALVQVDGKSPLALIVASLSGDFSAGRRGHPLYQLRTDSGVYYCSRPANSNFRLMADNEAY